MYNLLKKWRKDEESLAIERRLMNEALAQLGHVEKQQNEDGSSGRIIVGLDLTASRETSLHQARIATAAMFDTIKAFGSLAVKLIYYRGNWECKAGEWHTDPAIVSRYMLGLSCIGGNTQIARMLRSVLAEERRVSAVIFVGDHCEDRPKDLRKLAGALGERSIPLFMFHECAGDDARWMAAKPVFESMAELSGGVYVEFEPDSGTILREMLSSAWHCLPRQRPGTCKRASCSVQVGIDNKKMRLRTELKGGINDGR
jgi:hypothetical protein